MKVKFKNLIAGYTGKADDSVIYLHKETGQFIVRRRPKVTLNPQNHDISNTSSNLRKIQPSEAYKNNLRTYIFAYRQARIRDRKHFISWSNVFYALLYEMQRQYPEQVDLKTLTREQIYDQDLPCKSVAGAVAAGLLPQVKDWEMLTALI
jgi:hypothetical protein